MGSGSGAQEAGGSQVEGDKFFDREVELALLEERARNGIHTLLTAQQRKGKTSLIRELLLDLKPWDDETAGACLGALAETCRLDLPLDARRDMCRRLRCRIPHHVQEFFDNLHTVLRRAGRGHASLEDVERMYTGEMLGPRGQLNLEHYEGRLRMVLGDDDYPIAIELLTEAAIDDGMLRSEAVDCYHEHFPPRAEAPTNPIEYVLYVLGTTDIWSGTVTATGSSRVCWRTGGAPDMPGTSSLSMRAGPERRMVRWPDP